MIALIDADFYTYSIPFTCQDGRGKEACLNSEARFLKRKIGYCIDRILEETGSEDYKVYIQGEGNFRNNDETYKANRKNVERPILYDKAREVLRDSHLAVVVEGWEADDQVIIDYNKNIEMGVDAVMVHLDKDLDQADGFHYRPTGKKKGLYEVSKTEGLINLYTQALVGDNADNIKGVRGVGPVKAAKLLHNVVEEVDMWNICLRMYEGDEERLNRNMKNLYLLRHEDDKWISPDSRI